MALTALVNRAGSMVFVFTPIWLVQVHGFADHDAIFGTLLGGWLTDHLRALPVQLGTLVGMALGFVLRSSAVWCSGSTGGACSGSAPLGLLLLARCARR